MRKILLALLSVILVALVYYFFIRSHEFEINLKANTLPGDLIETIRIWNRSLDDANIVEVDSFSRLKQTVVRGNRNYIYNWNLITRNDSVTSVNVKITQPGRVFLNKLLIPFSDQPIEQDAKDIGNQFYTVVREHLKITKVRLEGEVELDSSFCVCRFLETSQIEKANGMMKDYALLTSFIDNFKLKINGPPSVRLREWSHSLNQVKFDFCFPIVRTDSLPMVGEITSV